MTPAQLYNLIQRRDALGDSRTMTHADADERAVLCRQIVAELCKMPVPLDYRGRRWGLMADRDGYCEIDPKTGCPAYASKAHAVSAKNLLFDYSKPPAAR